MDKKGMEAQMNVFRGAQIIIGQRRHCSDISSVKLFYRCARRWSDQHDIRTFECLCC